MLEGSEGGKEGGLEGGIGIAPGEKRSEDEKSEWRSGRGRVV